MIPGMVREFALSHPAGARLRALCRTARAFRSAREGSIAVVMALVTIPLVMAGAAAIDYARYNVARSELQTALDAALLSAARLPTSTAENTVRALAESELDKRINSSWMTDPNISAFKRVAGSTTASATARVPMTMMRIAGFDTMPVTANSQVSVATGKLEIALALDNSLSMKGARLTNLVTATNSLLGILENNVVKPDDVKIAIVPFDQAIKASTGYANTPQAPWIDFSDADYQSCNKYGCTTVKWKGCLIDRNQPYDTTDDSYTLKDSNGKKVALYPAQPCPNLSDDLATFQPLTTSFTTLGNKVKAMKASGYTNITIGVAFAHAMLSPDGPITGASAYGTENLQKIIVLMTDGENTANRWSSRASSINERTKLACSNAKADGITMYVVNFIEGDSTLLRGCATNDNYFYKVSSVSDLNQAFINIGDDISKLRLSK